MSDEQILGITRRAAGAALVTGFASSLSLLHPAAAQSRPGQWGRGGDRGSVYDHVMWPKRYDPRVSAIYALNDVRIKARPAVVWKLLVEAGTWSNYFPPENQVTLPAGKTELALGMHYKRVTIGVPMSLVITEFVPEHRLAWATTVDGDATGSTAYHGWVITPTATGCNVVSEETQQGPWFLEKLGREHPGGLYQYHQDWVEDLARAAEAAA